MERPDWRPEGYRPVAFLTDEEEEKVRTAFRQLLAGDLVPYSMGWHTDKNFAGGSTAVDCTSEAEARAECRRRFAEVALERDATLFIHRMDSPSGRHDWFRPAGIGCSIELKPGLVKWSRADMKVRPDAHPRIYLDPVQPDLFAAL